MKYPSLVLTYFNIEGAAEPTRLALTLAGVPFEDNRINFPDWKTLKPTTPYGQVPLLTIDGGPTKTQSSAMLRYAGTLNAEASLYPSDNMYEIEECMGVVSDMKDSWIPNQYIAMRPQKFGYDKDFSKTDAGKEQIKVMRQTWIKEELPKYLGFLAAKIEANGGKWLASGDKPTIADCFAVPILRNFSRGVYDHVDASCLDCNPVIVDYIKRFCALEAIKGRYTDGIH